jgi:protein-S-isoprenylcysteine O-methyltransferase Ste14
MILRELEQQGEWLFRWRSYVPLVLAPLAIWEVTTHRAFLGNSEKLDFAYKIFCLGISLSGLAIRFAVHGWALKGSSGRNTKGQIADNLNVAGWYSVVRHPLYVGNILMMLGIMLFTKSLSAAVAGVLAYVLIYERIIIVEEKFLAKKFGESYLIWAKSTPPLWPRWKHWMRPIEPFNWTLGWRAEFYGLLVIASAMLFLDTLDVWFMEHMFAANPLWVIFFTLSLITFIVLRYLRKNTRLLERDQPVPKVPEDTVEDEFDPYPR